MLRRSFIAYRWLSGTCCINVQIKPEFLILYGSIVNLVISYFDFTI